MTIALVVGILTVAAAFFCSLLEAVVLTTTMSEVELLKKRFPARAHAFESLRTERDEAILAIRTLDVLATTLGASFAGGFAAQHFGLAGLAAAALALTAAIVLAGEVAPHNLGVAFRASLQPVLMTPLQLLRKALFPVTWLCGVSMRLFEPDVPPAPVSSDEEFILLAEKSAKEGKLTPNESKLIANALRLDDVPVSEIMTPRTVVTALEKTATVAGVFREHRNIPFARIPVYEESLDRIVGMVRRRDLLKAKANDLDQEPVASLMQEVHFVPETVSASTALQTCLKVHQQLLVVVDEFGSVAGVVTMEDLMEQILGKEIFEKDDVAVDMRELARSRRKRSLAADPAKRPPV